jgi:hypothetical protein
MAVAAKQFRARPAWTLLPLLAKSCGCIVQASAIVFTHQSLRELLMARSVHQFTPFSGSVAAVWQIIFRCNRQTELKARAT